MADPKKPADDPAPQTAPPEPNKIAPEDMTYPTPELDPNTGAPLDTRFQGDRTQEAMAAQQPSPKSGAQDDEAQQAASRQAQRQRKDEDDDEDDDKNKARRGRRER